MPNLMNGKQEHTTIEASAPGRICLFGEHQDYLGLPVIAAAIDLRITLVGTVTDAPEFVLNLRDINKMIRLNPNQENQYTHNRDYITAAANVLRREGLKWDHGYCIEVSSEIPINAGASSSSALQVAWCAFLLKAAGDERASNPKAIAELAYLSEVVEFHSPGGRMDHYSTALGGVIWLDCKAPFKVRKLPELKGKFLLVDSGIPKDTNGVLGSIRESVEALGVDFTTADEHSIDDSNNHSTLQPLFAANLRNKAITRKAFALLNSEYQPEDLGLYLNDHQVNLLALGVSHPKIDEYLLCGIQLGALGGKINGSGAGGSFYFYAINEVKKIQKSMADLGLRSWEVSIGEGVKVNEYFNANEATAL